MKTSRLLLVLASAAAGLFAAYHCIGAPERAAATPSDTVRMVCAQPYPPYTYMHGGSLTGIDIELGDMIAREAGRKLTVSTATFSELINIVHDNGADMALCALASTHDRRKLVAFSDPYAFDGMIIMVRSDENITNLTDVEGRAGFRIGIDKGSTSQMLMDKYLADTKVDVVLVDYPQIAKAADALLNGEIDAVISDLLVAMCFQLEYPGRLTILSDMLNYDPLAVAIAPNDRELVDAANRVIHRLWATGGMFELKRKHAEQVFSEGGQHHAK